MRDNSEMIYSLQPAYDKNLTWISGGNLTYCLLILSISGSRGKGSYIL